MARTQPWYQDYHVLCHMFPSAGYLAMPSFIALMAVFWGSIESSIQHLAHHCPVCKLGLGDLVYWKMGVSQQCYLTPPDSYCVFIACVEMGSRFKYRCPGRPFPDAPFLMPLFRLLLHCVEFNLAVIILAFCREGNVAVAVSDWEPGKVAWVPFLHVLTEVQTRLVRVLPISKLLRLELA